MQNAPTLFVLRQISAPHDKYTRLLGHKGAEERDDNSCLCQRSDRGILVAFDRAGDEWHVAACRERLAVPSRNMLTNSAAVPRERVLGS